MLPSVQPSRFPGLTYVRKVKTRHILCSAGLLSMTRAITAAYPVKSENKQNLRLIVGTVDPNNRGKRYSIEEILYDDFVAVLVVSHLTYCECGLNSIKLDLHYYKTLYITADYRPKDVNVEID